MSSDEKSQIQALDRTQPGLPMKKGRCNTMTHDYIGNGTTTLFAALNVLDGKVIGRCMQQHRHQEFIRFLNTVEAAVPAGKIVHAIADNYATHKHPKVREWLISHPRWTSHFTPTSASWLNAVEGYFAKLTKRRLNVAGSDPSLNCKPPSSTSSPKPTLIHGPSGGPRILTKSSPPSEEGTKCWIYPLEQEEAMSAQDSQVTVEGNSARHSPSGIDKFDVALSEEASGRRPLHSARCFIWSTQA